jgi:hypothetical protein
MAARDKLAHMLAGLSAERQQDLEAERARLVQLLLDPPSAVAAAAEVAAMTAATQEAASAAAAAAAGPLAPGSAASDSDASAAKPAVLRRLPAPPKLPGVAAAHYLLDFGFATKGVNKARKVKITNTSMQQVRGRGGVAGRAPRSFPVGAPCQLHASPTLASNAAPLCAAQIQFTVDKPLLEAFGFGMSPEANVKLAGAPQCEVGRAQARSVWEGTGAPSAASAPLCRPRRKPLWGPNHTCRCPLPRRRTASCWR